MTNVPEQLDNESGVTWYEALPLAKVRGSSVSVVTKLRAAQYEFRFSQRLEIFLFSKTSKSALEPYVVARLIGMGLLLVGEAAGVLSWSLASICFRA